VVPGAGIDPARHFWRGILSLLVAFIEVIVAM